VLAAPSPSTYEALLAEQEAWATQSDKRTVEFLSVLAASGGKAIGNAGARQSERDVTWRLAVHHSPLWRSTDQVSWRRRLCEGLLCPVWTGYTRRAKICKCSAKALRRSCHANG